VTPFVVLEAGDDGILSFRGTRSRRRVTGDLIERVGLEVCSAFGEVEFWLLPMLLKVWFFKGFETSRDGLI